jgi:hypothetical protein
VPSRECRHPVSESQNTPGRCGDVATIRKDQEKQQDRYRIQHDAGEGTPPDFAWAIQPAREAGQCVQVERDSSASDDD